MIVGVDESIYCVGMSDRALQNTNQQILGWPKSSFSFFFFLL